MKRDVIATYGESFFSDVLIYLIDYDVNDFVVFSWDTCGNIGRTCKSRIRYDKSGEAYFNTRKRRVHLSECLRTEVTA